MKYNIFFHSLKLQKKNQKQKKNKKNPQKTNKQKNDIFIRFLFINIRIEKKICNQSFTNYLYY